MTRQIFVLMSLGVPEPPFERLLGTRGDWQALGVELTGERDERGEIARYRGEPTARLWTLDRSGDGVAGVIWGSTVVQGYGVVGDQPWYFRARHDHWSLSIALTLDLDPLRSSRWTWIEECEDAGELEQDVAWACVERVLGFYRDSLVQEMTRTTDPGDPALAAAYRASRCWHAMASLAAKAGGPVEQIRHALWRFGIHPRMDRDAEGVLEWDLPLDHTIASATHAHALAEAGSLAELDRRICERLRELWPL
jgi:hypothetical protein